MPDCGSKGAETEVVIKASTGITNRALIKTYLKEGEISKVKDRREISIQGWVSNKKCGSNRIGVKLLKQRPLQLF